MYSECFWFSGLWVGLKTMKDTIEATAVVESDLNRYDFVVPEFDMPEGGLNIRLVDDRHKQEERLIRTIADQTAFYQRHRDLFLTGRYVGSEALASDAADLSLAAWWVVDAWRLRRLPPRAAVLLVKRQ